MQSIFLHDLKDYFKLKLNYSSLAHRLCCLLAGLVMVFSLLLCVLSIKGAVDDLRKYGDLGAPYSLGYYLAEHGFLQDLLGFLLLIPEFLVYLILRRRAAEMRRPDKVLWYFGAALLLHGALLVRAAPLNCGEITVFTMTVTINPYFLVLFACATLLQSVGYLVAYLLRVRQLGYLIKRG